MLYQQPQVGPFALDHSVITSSNGTVFLPPAGADVFSNSTVVFNGLGKTVSPDGQALLCAGGSGNRIELTNKFSSSNITLVTSFIATAQSVIVIGSFNNSADGHYVSIESNGVISAVSTDGNTYQVLAGISYVAGQKYTVVAVFTNAGRSIFINGQKVASSTNALTVANTARFSLGAYIVGAGNSAQNYFSGTMSLGCALPYAMSDASAQTISANSWQIFADEDDEDVYKAAVAGIAFDASSSSTYQTASSSYTFNRTITGTNTFLSVDVSLLGTATVTSVTDDSTGAAIPMSLLGTSTNGIRRVESWGLAGASTGTKTISVVLSAAVASAATSTSYINVNQVISTEAFNSSTGTNAGTATDASVSVTTVADLCWVHAAIATDDTSITANQTSRSNVTGALGSGADEDNNAAVTPAGAVTMSYTGLGITAAWAMSGYALRPLSAAGGVFSSNGSSTGTSVVSSTARNVFTTAGSSIGSTTLTSVARAVAVVTGSSSGLVSVNASSNSVFTSSGVSTGTSTVTAVSNTVFTVTGSSSGSSNVNASAGSLYGVVGNSVGSGNVQATSVSITQTTASAIGSSTASAASVTIGASNGSSAGSATLSGVGNAIWKVLGTSSGIAIVSGNGADAAGGTTTVSAAGSALGTSTVNATANALSQAIANAFGSSVVGAQGALIAAVIANATGTSTVAATSGKVVFTSGSSTGSSSVSANANSVVGSAGTSAGTSSVQSAVLIIYQAQGFAPGVSDAQAAARAIQKAIGQSSGTCVVAGITQGGVHYIGKGDHLSVTLILSPYEITLNDTSFNIIKN